MAILKCKMCGANLNPKEGETICECEYCGSRQTISTSNDDKVLKVIARGTVLRNKCEFDKAYNLYSQLVVDGIADAEAYWNLVLCKYGITYVDDYDGSKKPTINRMSTTYIKEDEDFKKAIDLADAIAKQQYLKEADEIQTIQQGILDIVNKEEPYDIFISYKETDEIGDRTEDSVLAQDIYDTLTKEGYRVFLSRISLSSLAGQGYEPYIYSALFTSKAMVLVGTDEEYLNAVWVKNEWSRFLNMMAKDKSKKLIPCFKNIDAYDLPREIQSFQGIDFNKLGAMQDLVIGVKKIIKKEKKEEKPVNSNIDLTMQFQRLGKTLNEEKWDNADIICDTILTLDPNSAEAYFGKILVAFKCSNIDQLYALNQPIEENENYKLAINVANKEMKEKISNVANTIKENIKENFYNSALEYEKNEEYEKANEQLEKILDYKDSKTRYEMNTKLSIYNRAINLKNNNNLIESLEIFDTIDDFKDSNDYIAQIKDEMISKSKSYLNNKDYDKARELCDIIKDYKGFSEQFEEETKYLQAKDLLDSSNIYSLNKTLKAIEIFKELNNYKDSKEWYLKAQDLYNKTIYEKVQFNIRNNNFEGIEELLNKIIDYKDCRQILENLSNIEKTKECKNNIKKAIDNHDEEAFNECIKFLEKDPNNQEYIKLSKDRFDETNPQKGKSWFKKLFKK